MHSQNNFTAGSNGQLCLLLPGFIDTTTSKHFQAIKDELLELNYTVAEVNLGNLYSPLLRDTSQYTLSNYLAAIKQAISQAKSQHLIDKAHLIGHSMGAFAALLCAENTQINSIAALMPPSQIPGNSKIRDKEPEWLAAGELEFLLLDGVTRVAIPYSFVQDARSHQLNCVNINAPVLYVAGSDDKITLATDIELLHNKTYNSKYTLIEGCPHNYSSNQTYVKDISAKVIDFIAQN